MLNRKYICSHMTVRTGTGDNAHQEQQGSVLEHMHCATHRLWVSQRITEHQIHIQIHMESKQGYGDFLAIL